MQSTLRIKNDKPVYYSFPGVGHECGLTGWKWRACPSMRHAVRYKNSCHRRDCKTHWRDWLKEESAAAAQRINAVKGRWQHVVVSLGKNWVLPTTTEDRHREMARVRNYLIKVGFKGGAIVVHSARAHTATQTHTADSGGHYHGYCVGWCDSKRVSDLFLSNGVMVKAFGKDCKRVFQRVEYMLSHAALPFVLNPARLEGTTSLHSITYWGILAYNKLKIPEYQAEYYCPGCHEWFPARSWHDLRLLDEPPDRECIELGEGIGRLFEPIGWCDK